MMAKKRKRKLSEPTWAIRIEDDGIYKSAYLRKGNRVMLFGTRAAAREHLQEVGGWLREISNPVRADVVQR